MARLLLARTGLTVHPKTDESSLATNTSLAKEDRHDRLIVALVLILIAYAVLCAAGWPQQAAELIAVSQRAEAAIDRKAEHPPFWMIAPFASLLAMIAIMPLTNVAARWWERNRNKALVAGGLAALTLAYYLLLHDQPTQLHWPLEHVAAATTVNLNWNALGRVLVNAILGEYLPFIILLFSLYSITGGIRIEGDLRAHPATNTLILAVGAFLASLIGTTGAAMLLIRLLLETNSERKHVKHTVVMFIFIVCNCGGCLLPLGDPPLFLGYLFGVPFLWTLRLWPAWLFVNGSLLLLYFLWDGLWCYPREAAADIRRDRSQVRPLSISGLWPNVWLLIGVIAAVALLDPAKPFLGTRWHPWGYLREMVLLALVLCSFTVSRGESRRQNSFDFAAIIEVAVLFAGIFVCMQPPLEILHAVGPSLGLATPTHFFWAAGSLSSVLDNAPTYAVFFATARSLGGGTVAGVQAPLLAAVSLGSVFLGAMTYIGNGPNFMVKSIAEKSGVAMPTFFGYIVYSVVILLPLFALATLIL